MYFIWEQSSANKCALMYHENYRLSKLKYCEVPRLYYFNEALKLLKKKEKCIQCIQAEMCWDGMENKFCYWKQYDSTLSHKFHYLENLNFIFLIYVTVKFGELNQRHILNSNEYKPWQLKTQFSNFFFLTHKLHEVLWVSHVLWCKITPSTWRSIEELHLNLLHNAVVTE